jgi:hypothetical protein
MSSVSKPFQKYYRKAKEGRSWHLDENLFAKSVAAMRLSVSFSAKEVVAVTNSAGVADSVKVFVNPSISMKGFLWRRFLNPEPDCERGEVGLSQPEPGRADSSYLTCRVDRVDIDSGSKKS